MQTIEAPAKLRFMTIADILALRSVDAEVELDYQEQGKVHALMVTGPTVADIIERKRHEVDTEAVYQLVIEGMYLHGQTVPIAVREGYLVNGHHRVAIAIMLGWSGLWTTDDCGDSTDHAWDSANPQHAQYW